jgi:hypothetical protein
MFFIINRKTEVHLQFTARTFLIALKATFRLS